MRYLKTYESFGDSDNNLYDKSWENLLPHQLTIIKEGEHIFNKGNVMLNSDMVQITYSNDEKGFPNTLEFDIYFASVNGVVRLDIDITYGDLVVSEFSIEGPNKVDVVEYTSYHSKFDPSNTVFALSDNSLASFVAFLNKFENMKLTISDFKFLDKSDDYNPS